MSHPRLALLKLSQIYREEGDEKWITIHFRDRSDDWLKYGVFLHLLHVPKDELSEIRITELADDWIQNYLKDIEDFHSILVTSHKNPDLTIHKLLFLLDIGFDMDVPEINNAVTEILLHRDDNGIFQSMTNVPKHFGGAGIDVFSWCLCDAPLLLLSLLKAGVDYEAYIKPGVDHLST